MKLLEQALLESTPAYRKLEKELLGIAKRLNIELVELKRAVATNPRDTFISYSSPQMKNATITIQAAGMFSKIPTLTVRGKNLNASYLSLGGASRPPITAENIEKILNAALNKYGTTASGRAKSQRLPKDF